jgi:HEAT repeat protein
MPMTKLMIAVLMALAAGTARADVAQDLQYGTAEARETALDQVLAGQGAGAGPALLAALPELNGAAKLKAIRGLGVLREDRAVKALIDLLEDPSSDFRLAAAKSLGRIADPSAAGALAKLLKDGDDEVRETAARALAQCGSAKDVKALGALLGDKNRLVRLAAIDSLGALGAEGALPLLQKELDDKDPGYQRHVIKAIGSLKGDKVLPFLKDGLKSADAFVRTFSLEALSARPPVPALEPALLGLLNDPVYAVRVRAVDCLGRWKSRAGLDGLLKALRAPEPTLRWKASQALGRIGDARAREALEYVAAKDAEAEIRAAAKAALSELD